MRFLSLRLLGVAALGLLAVGAARDASAQDVPGEALPGLAPAVADTTGRLYGTSQALAFQITEFGLGAGVASRMALTDDWSGVAELSLGAGRDEREQQFFVGFFGDSIVPFKRNYVLMVPLRLGVERRLFRRAIEDNFRPFVHASAGPTLALQWPYFDDADGDGQLDEGDERRLSTFAAIGDAEPRLGVGVTLAVGAAFGRSRRVAQSVRFGVAGDVFPGEIDLLELDPAIERPSRRAFWTPVISVHIARL